MIAPAGMKMGRFAVEVELVNHRDQILADAGQLQIEKVRRARVRGVVDSGAARLVLPATTVAQLGLPTAANTTVRYAANRTADRQIASDIELRYRSEERRVGEE